MPVIALYQGHKAPMLMPVLRKLEPIPDTNSIISLERNEKGYGWVEEYTSAATSMPASPFFCNVLSEL